MSWEPATALSDFRHDEVHDDFHERNDCHHLLSYYPTIVMAAPSHLVKWYPHESQARTGPGSFAQTQIDTDLVFYATFPQARPTSWTPSAPYSPHIISHDVFPFASPGSPFTETSMYSPCAESPQSPSGATQWSAGSSELSAMLPMPKPLVSTPQPTGGETSPEVIERIQPAMIVPSQQRVADVEKHSRAASPSTKKAARSEDLRPSNPYPNVPRLSPDSQPLSDGLTRPKRLRIRGSGDVYPALADASSGKSTSKDLPLSLTSFGCRQASFNSSQSESGPQSSMKLTIGTRLSSRKVVPPPPPPPTRTIPSNASADKQARKPALACTFCRGRKIACGQPSPDSEDRTCNQCRRRSLKCTYPVESRRGLRKKKEPVEEDSDE